MASELLENLPLNESHLTENAGPIKTALKPRRSWKQFMFRKNERTAYHCDFKDCNKIFNHLSSLIKHEKIHGGGRPYSCKVCHQNFAKSSKLRRHEKTHSGERSFACTQCENKFSTASNMRQHSQIHKENVLRKHYTCENCERSYLYRSSLNKHMKHCIKEETMSGAATNTDISQSSTEEPSLKKFVRTDTKAEETSEGHHKLVQASAQNATQNQVNLSTLFSYAQNSMLNSFAKAHTALTALPIAQPIRQPILNPVFSTRNQLLQNLTLQTDYNNFPPQVYPLNIASTMLSPPLSSVNFSNPHLLLYQKQNIQEYNLKLQLLKLQLSRIPFC